MSSFLSVSPTLYLLSFLCHPISHSLSVFSVLLSVLFYLLRYSSSFCHISFYILLLSISFSHLFSPSLSRTSTLCHLLRSTPTNCSSRDTSSQSSPQTPTGYEMPVFPSPLGDGKTAPLETQSPQGPYKSLYISWQSARLTSHRFQQWKNSRIQELELVELV